MEPPSNCRPLAMWPDPDDSPATVAMLEARRAYYVALEAEEDYRAEVESRLADLRARRQEADTEYKRTYDALKAESAHG